MMKAILAGLLFLMCLNLPGQSQAQVLEHVTIYKKPGVYACFPDLYKADNGTLVATFGTRTSKSHHDTIGSSQTFVSMDQGHTWQAAEKEYINPAYRHADGRIVIPAATSWKSVTPEEVSKLKSQKIQVDRVQGNYFYAVGAFLKISRDGSSWAEEKLSLPAHALLLNYTSGYLRTKSGTFLSAKYGKFYPGQKFQVFFLRSEDDGKTWNFFPMAASSPKPDKYLGFNETALAETDHDTIVAMMRSEPDSDGYLFSSISINGGLTWSVPQKTAVWGYPAHLLFFEGKFICTYGYRRAPMGVRVSVFTDNFSQPSTPELILRSDAMGSPGDVGYPITVALGNREFFTIYYLTAADGITHVAGTRWRLRN